ncbi:MAG: type II secretion system protein N [Pseudomonadota bacterium]
MTGVPGLGSPGRWLAVAAVGLLGALVWQLPASVLGHALPTTSVQLAALEGTVWRGKAGRVLAGQVDLGTARWRTAWAPLALGRVAAEVDLAGPSLRGRGLFERRLSGALSATDVKLSMPAGWLQHLLNQPQLRLLGELDVHLKRARFDAEGWLLALDGRARWVAARVAGGAGALGDLSVTWTTREDGVIEGKLSDSGGPLALSGTVQLADRQYVINARLAARDGSVPLRRTLALLGRAEAGGAVRLDIYGPLVPLAGG